MRAQSWACLSLAGGGEKSCLGEDHLVGEGTLNNGWPSKERVGVSEKYSGYKVYAKTLSVLQILRLLTPLSLLTMVSSSGMSGPGLAR